ncbi:MAG: Gfo/Idh/MocA family oxidoreductase [Patescibacteria group bacterium]
MNRRKLKVAIVGFGHIAPTAYLGALAHVPELELVSVADNDPAAKRNVPAGVGFYAEIEEMLGRREADAVVVAVPQSDHYAVARKCLESGCDILLEKPATETMADFESLVETAEKCGKLIIFNAHAAFGLDVLWFKKYAAIHPAIRALGGITGFHAGFYDPNITSGGVVSGKSLGGSWRDSGVNALCSLEALGALNFSTLRMEQNLSTKRFAPYEDQGCAHFSFRRNGRTVFHGTIDTNWTTERNLKFTELYYRNGSAILLHHSNEKVILRHPDGRREMLADCRNGKARLVNHYVGVFRDFSVRLKQRSGNTDTARAVHELYFEFYDRSPFDRY